jgi:hypothetical protein
VAVMTIYDPCFAGAGYPDEYQKAAEAAVSIFNDVIQREAAGMRYTVMSCASCSRTKETMRIPSSLCTGGDKDRGRLGQVDKRGGTTAMIEPTEFSWTDLAILWFWFGAEGGGCYDEISGGQRHPSCRSQRL